MSEFKYRILRKKTCWDTDYITIEAESKEEADLLAAKIAMYDEDHEPYDSETNSYDDLSIEENGGYATIELYDSDFDLLADNTELQNGYTKFEEAIAKKKELDNVPKAEIEW